jgi:hypothetical protein
LPYACAAAGSGTGSSHQRAFYKASDPESRCTQITQICTAAVDLVGDKSLRQIRRFTSS